VRAGAEQDRDRSGRPAAAPLRFASRLLDWLENVAAVLAGILLVGSFATVILEVVSRQFFGTSFEWVIEMNENILIWATLLGAPWVLRDGGHVRVDLLETIMSGAVRRVGDVLIALVGVAVSLVLVWFGVTTTLDSFETGRVTLTSARLPEAWIILVIPVGGALLALEFLRQGYRAAVGERSSLEGSDVAL
jgi:TRAP-type C4-dicarboxylate transport system permease small subunit